VSEAAGRNESLQGPTIQTLEVMPLDWQRIRPDYLVAVGYKWLLGPFGLASLYVAQEHRGGRPLEQNWISRLGSQDFPALVDYQGPLPARRALSPLTGLPGNNRIEQEIQARMERGQAIAVVYADLDNFKSFNDRYGFLRGDEVISLAAQVLRLAAQEAAGPDGFVGHIGGDDFVAIVPPEAAEGFSTRVIESFDARILSLDDPEDAGAGMIELEDRQGAAAPLPDRVDVAGDRLQRPALVLQPPGGRGHRDRAEESRQDGPGLRLRHGPALHLKVPGGRSRLSDRVIARSALVRRVPANVRNPVRLIVSN